MVPCQRRPWSIVVAAASIIIFSCPSLGSLAIECSLPLAWIRERWADSIILPPSHHVSGRPYMWDSDHDLETTPLAAAPDWLVRLIQQPQAAQPAPARR